MLVSVAAWHRPPLVIVRPASPTPESLSGKPLDVGKLIPAYAFSLLTEVLAPPLPIAISKSLRHSRAFPPPHPVPPKHLTSAPQSRAVVRGPPSGPSAALHSLSMHLLASSRQEEPEPCRNSALIVQDGLRFYRGLPIATLAPSGTTLSRMTLC